MKSRSGRRSGCPVSIALDLFGDRWSLLIVRDLMVRGYRRFGQFAASGEGIATNILADRLRKLAAAGIIFADADGAIPGEARGGAYRLTDKGIELAPVLLEMLIWSGRHEPTAAPRAVIEEMAANRETILKETRRRWLERDPTPLLPPFGASTKEPTPAGPKRSVARGKQREGKQP